jgi:hypothetical protein
VTGSVRVDLVGGQHLRRLGATMNLMKIGHEWVEAGDCDGAMLAIGRRGLLGTVATSHPPGTPVLYGRKFERIVPLPSPRSDLTSRDASGGRK